MSSFKYIWKKRNAVTDDTIIKQTMQNLYKGVQVLTPADNLEYTYPLFDTFWNNTGLRGTMFGVKPIEDSPEQFKIDSKNRFIQLVSDSTFNNTLYSFINVK